MEELTELGAAALASRIRYREVSPLDVACSVIERLAAVQPTINAFTFHDADRVIDEARKLTDEAALGRWRGPLHGIPYSVKALTAVAGLPATSGVEPWRDAVAPVSAPVAERLTAAGGLLIGLTNCSEVGYAAATRNHLYGSMANPIAPGLTVGGSSAGAAAAVAAGIGPLAEGTDGAGSVRIPASCCGVVGFKPSFGRIPVKSGRWGRTHVHHGVLARSVVDAALFVDTVAGPDHRDPFSLPAGDVGLVAATTRSPLSGLRIGWSHDLGLVELDPAVQAVFDSAVTAVAHQANAVESSPNLRGAQQVMWTIWRTFYAPLKDVLDRDAVGGRVDDDLLGLIDAGARVGGEERDQADLDRMSLWHRLVDWFDAFDILLTPTLAVPPFPGDQAWPPELATAPLQERLLGWLLTYPFNLLPACPAISIPAGTTPAGAPVGIQIVGKPWADATVIAVAAEIEAALSEV